MTPEVLLQYSPRPLAGEGQGVRVAGRETASVRRAWLSFCPVLAATTFLVLSASLCLAETEDTLEARRARIEAMSPAEKQAILERQQRFARLAPEEQDRLRRLNEQLQQDPQGNELRQVMAGYYNWLKTLPPYQQAELADLPPDRRVVRVKKLMEEQAQRDAQRLGSANIRREEWAKRMHSTRYGRLTPDDQQIMLEWFFQHASKHVDRFLETLPPERREDLEKQLATVQNPKRPDLLRRNEILGTLWLRWHLNEAGKSSLLTEKELAELRGKISRDAREWLGAKSPVEQSRLVTGVIQGYLFRQYATRREDSHLPLVSDEELADFFEKELTAKQRDDLLKFSGEELQRELWRMYLRWKIANTGIRPKEPADGKKEKGEKGKLKEQSP